MKSIKIKVTMDNGAAICSRDVHAFKSSTTIGTARRFLRDKNGKRISGVYTPVTFDK